jgi:N-acetylglucosamine-6-phosphate deacetylase
MGESPEAEPPTIFGKYLLPSLIVKHVHTQEGPQFRDSIEIGTEKFGKIKVYGDAGDPEGFTERIKTMITLRERAQLLMVGSSPEEVKKG